MLQIRVIPSCPGNVVDKHFPAHHRLHLKASLPIHMLTQKLLVIVCLLIIHLEKYQSMPSGYSPVATRYLSTVYNGMLRSDWEVGNLGVCISLQGLWLQVTPLQGWCVTLLPQVNGEVLREPIGEPEGSPIESEGHRALHMKVLREDTMAEIAKKRRDGCFGQAKVQKYFPWAWVNPSKGGLLDHLKKDSG